MIHHVVSFRWKPETGADQIDKILAALRSMPGLVPQISTYHFGSDLGVGNANVDFAIVATFDTIEDWRIYDEHPEHERVRREIIRPWVAERTSVQFRS